MKPLAFGLAVGTLSIIGLSFFPTLTLAEDSNASSSDFVIDEEAVDTAPAGLRASSLGLMSALEEPDDLINTHSTELNASLQQSWVISDSVQTGLDLTSDFTLEAWAKADSFPHEENNIINKYFGADGRRGYRLFVTDAGNLRLIICNIFEVCDDITTAYQLPLGEWHHIAVTWNPPTKTMRFYIDGELEESFGGTITSIRNNLRPFRIGTNDLVTNQWWDGNLDDIRVWNAVRSAEDIANNYNRELAGTEAGLKGYWKFNDDGGIDRTVNTNHLEGRNSPSFSTDIPEFIDEDSIDPLILKHEPILYFHPEEDFYPMNVEAFIETSALWDDRDLLEDEQLIPAGEVTVEDITNPDSEDWYLAFSTPDEAKSFDPTAAKQKYGALVSSGEAVPTYYARKMDQGDWTVLQYWYFYAFNGWQHELGELGNNNHEGDWESVFIFLDKHTKEPEYIAYSSHLNDGDPEIFNRSQYDSVRREWSDSQIDLVNDKPVSFISLGSHANYPKNGVDGIHIVPAPLKDFQDWTSSAGEHLMPENWQIRKIIGTTNPSWITYEGKWGTDGELLPGSDGPRGPALIDVNIFSNLKRFHEPVKWAGLDKISTEAGDGSESFFSFENQTTQMSFSGPVPEGETVTSDQHDELITFGNLDEVELLPRFWDFETSMEDGTFDVTVGLGYDEEEVSALGLDEEKLSAFLYNESTNIWEEVGSVVDAAANTISFDTTHFSRYAIGQEVVTNEPPALHPIGDKTVSEGGVLTFVVTAEDLDEGDTLTFSAGNLPLGASFNPLTQTFYWDTDFDDAGSYTDVEFAVVDDGEPLGLDVELIKITVGDVNRAPVFENPGPQEILEDERLDLALSALDPDGDMVELSAINMPERSSLSTSTGVFTWKPTRSQEGVYVVTFVATDNGVPHASSTLDVVITVGDNPTPVEQANVLIDLVLSHQFSKEIENSYLANLKKAPTFIEEGKITPAIQQLEAFVQKVEMDYKKGRIDLEAKSALLQKAIMILDALSSGN